MTPRRWLLLTLFAIGIGCAGCNLPTNPSAIRFSAAPASSSCSGPISVTIYLVKATANRLVPVVRHDVAKTGDAPLCALNALDAGPTAEEVINQLSTAFVSIPEGLGLSDVSGGTATVQLDANFVGIASKKSVYQAFGQIVFTLTGLNAGIDRVQFVLDNRPYAGVILPNGTGRLNGLVTRQDYCAIAPVGEPCAPSKTANSVKGRAS